jgi:hypothetical protein
MLVGWQGAPLSNLQLFKVLRLKTMTRRSLARGSDQWHCASNSPILSLSPMSELARGSLVQLTTLQGSSIKHYGTTIFGTGLPCQNPILHGAHFQTSPQILWLAWHGAPLSKSQLSTARSIPSLSFGSPTSFFFGRGLPCSTSSASRIAFRRFLLSVSFSPHPNQAWYLPFR